MLDPWRAILRLGGKLRLRLGKNGWRVSLVERKTYAAYTRPGLFQVHGIVFRQHEMKAVPRDTIEMIRLAGASAAFRVITQDADADPHELGEEAALDLIAHAVDLAADRYDEEDPLGEDAHGITRGRVCMTGLDVSATEWGCYQRKRVSWR